MALPPAAPLLPGTVVAGRYLVEHHAGHGGMGSVFRAQDTHSGRTVALKLLHSTDSPKSVQRFIREAELLAELRHPGIVTYVAHGVAEGHQPFLVMEWLEGKNLAQRLGRQPLNTAQVLIMFRRIVEALATAHQRGIVHRDIKPSNLFLRSDRVEDVVLLDFGLARRVVLSQVVTGNSAVLGTPGYMAPEQASSGADVTPGADVFALGCVLYECLTGQPPFLAPSLAAVLAKILFTEPPPLSSLRQDLPASWQRLVDGMLAKDPRRRLPDARSVQEALAAMGAESPGGLPPVLPLGGGYSTGLSGSEQQLVSVLLAAPPVPVADSPTLSLLQEAPEGSDLLASLCAERVVQGGQIERLADGSLLATFLPERGVATDQAALAARSALLLKERWPEARVVLTTGRGMVGGRVLTGEAMDRVGELQRWVAEGPASCAAHPVLDELTAGLLGPGFLLAPARPGAFLLKGELLSADETRPLLGRPTPCVGRERELSILELAFCACTEESSARALLITAPDGIGKSRLRHEFLRRLERQGQGVLVLQARGAPVGNMAAQGLLSQALRRLCGVHEAEGQEVQWEKFARRISRHLAPEQARTTTEFLGELCGLSFPTDDSPRLRAARGDSALMSAQLTRALVSFLRAECKRGPVLLVLEDLHWGDVLTVRLVDEALRELSECPLMVLALARPEVKTLFPGLWSRYLNELSLSGLSKRAAARLVQEVLGTDLVPSLIDRIVSQARGNALFLEELIRAVKEGRGEEPPGTILAMLQARLGWLRPEARHVLRAASVLGHTFWAGGVRALLGRELSTEMVAGQLRHLVELELIEQQPESRFPAEAEFRFRHALVRDAAYGLVPEGFKAQGHRLAGEWLEQAGETDPMVLAEHYHLGGQRERAIHFHAQAAEQLFERHDLNGTLRQVEAARDCGADGEVLVRLGTLQALSAFWRGDFAGLHAVGNPVLSQLAAGSKAWCKLIGYLITGSALSGRPQDLGPLTQFLLDTAPEPEATPFYAEAVVFIAISSIYVGDRQQATLFLERLEQVETEVMARDAIVRGWIGFTRGFFNHCFEARPWQALQWAEQGRRAFLDAGSEHNALAPLSLSGTLLAALGDVRGGAERQRESVRLGRQTGQGTLLSSARIHLALLLASYPGDAAGDQEARALALEELASSNNRIYVGVAQDVLARLAARQGSWTEAEAHARQACEVLALSLHYRLLARQTLCAVRMAQGHPAEAREVALLGVQELGRMGGSGMGSVGIHLSLAEACLALGDRPAADSALHQALQCLRERTSNIPEPAARERFLSQVPENARVLRLARQRWGEQAWP